MSIFDGGETVATGGLSARIEAVGGGLLRAKGDAKPYSQVQGPLSLNDPARQRELVVDLNPGPGFSGSVVVLLHAHG
jgi:hypothetical protein